MTNSGLVARIAGDTIGASYHLPNMADEQFLSCLSKAAIEQVAISEGVAVQVRGKNTRAAVITRHKDSRYIHPAALFALTEAEIAGSIQQKAGYWVNGHPPVPVIIPGEDDAGAEEHQHAGGLGAARVSKRTSSVTPLPGSNRPKSVAGQGLGEPGQRSFD